MNTAKQLFSYLFGSNPGDLKLYIPIIILISGLFLASIISHFIYKNHKKHDPAFRKLFKNTTPRLVYFGIFFLFYAMVRYENIPYFSMRLWFYLGLLLLAFVTYKTIQKYRIDYPREKYNVDQIKSSQAKKEEKRYLPNKKKK